MKNQQIVVVHDKPESTLVKLMQLMALIMATPLIFIGVIVAIAATMTVILVLISYGGAGILPTVVPWLVAVVLLCSLAPAMRDRISGRHKIRALKAHIHELELELSEARLEMLKEHETAEFHKKLNETPKADASINIKESKTVNIKESRKF